MANICKNYVHIQEVVYDDDGEISGTSYPSVQVYSEIIDRLRDYESGVFDIKADCYGGREVIECETKWTPKYLVQVLKKLSNSFSCEFEFHYFERGMKFCGVVVIKKGKVTYVNEVDGYEGFLGG